MNKDEFKKLLEEALEPIKVTQKEHTKILEKHTEILEKHTDVLEEHTDVLEEHSRALETLQVSTVTIENTINAYGDMYQINNSNGRKLEKRIETLEENANITPPSELTLAEVN